MRLHGNANLRSNNITSFVVQPLTEFPVGVVGKAFYKSDEGNIFVCTSASPDVWRPFGNNRSSVHVQNSAATVWNVAHYLNTTNIIIQALDSSNELIIPEDINIVDANTVQVYLTVAITGKVCVQAVSYTLPPGPGGGPPEGGALPIGQAVIGSSFIVG